MTALVFALAFARVAFASPEDLFSYGTRSPAMGGTGAACAEGFEAAYLNPALLSAVRRNRLALGLSGASFRLTVDGQPVSSTPAKGIVIGAEFPVPFGGALKDRVGVGLAFYTPTDVIVRGRIVSPETAQFPLLPDRAQSVTIRAGLGADLGYGLRIGAGFAALAEIGGSAIVATDATGKVGTRVEDQLIATYAPTFGLTYDAVARGPLPLRLGLTYRGELDARFSVDIDATKLSSLPIPVLNVAGVAQFDPEQLAFEIASTTQVRALAVGVTYKRWSRYPGPLEPTIHCPSDSPGCGALVPPGISYDDTLSVHAGGEYTRWLRRDVKGHLRGGAAYEPNPLPHGLATSLAYDAVTKQVAEVPTRYFNSARVLGTVGAGVELEGDLPHITLDFYAQYHALLSSASESVSASGSGSPLGSGAGSILAGGFIAGVRF